MFVPGHRKSRSDGANIFLSCSGGGSRRTQAQANDWSSTGSGTLSTAGSDERFRQHHLLDDSLMEDPCSASAVGGGVGSVGGGSSASDHAAAFDLSEKSLLTEAKLSPEELNVEPGTKCTFQVRVRGSQSHLISST